MKLLIDIGNTRLKWAVFRNGKLSQTHAFNYAEGVLSEYFSHTWSALDRPESVYLVSVVGTDIEAALNEWCFTRWGIEATHLKSQRYCCGVRNGYTEYRRLGIDRWAAIIAAYRLTNSAVCVIDSGTAFTCDAVSRDGQHLGGLIVPGSSMQKRLLLENTKGITMTKDAEAGIAWGRDTSNCVESGIVQSQLGLIERSVMSLQTDEAAGCALVLTGGAATTLLPFITHSCRYEPDLVFQGMLHIIREQERG